MKKLLISILMISLILMPSMSLANDKKEIDNFGSYFYNRYSSHFDHYGLVYSVPTYGVSNFIKADTARMWTSLATYYKYRAQAGDLRAKMIIRESLFKALNELSGRSVQTQSFNDAEALFLFIRMIESIPDLLNTSEQEAALDLITKYIEAGILANDTENRAIVAGAHWQYINDYLYQKGKINIHIKKYFDELIKQKVDKGIRESIFVTEGWYFEDNKKAFSVHYHTISAFMLLVYADLTNQEYYSNLAEKMYLNIKKISFKNGMVEARLGARPIGLGAQFYLAMAFLGNRFSDSDYQTYLFYASGNRFFSDKKYPNRLEFHSTIESSFPNYHDDYAFCDVLELGLVNNKLKEMEIKYQVYLSQPEIKSNDKYFNIVNSGNIIFVNNQKNYLGSQGNWSHLFKK